LSRKGTTWLRHKRQRQSRPANHVRGACPRFLAFGGVMQRVRALPLLAATLVGIAIHFASPRNARAVPSFARKYQTGCQTCHTVYPVLNPFGEAFRRDGYRFPSQNGSVDSDAAKATE